MKIIVTDLDGTLLDKDTYSAAAAVPLLDELRKKGIPVIFCSSKTRAEVELYRKCLGNEHPFIVENGGALFVPSGYFPFHLYPSLQKNGYALFEFGTSYPLLVKALLDAAQNSDCPVTGFSAMSTQEISNQCKLPLELAALAKQREYDEPFLIHDVAKTGPLLKNIERLGFRWTFGGRFYHIHGNNNKGFAAKVLRYLYRDIDLQITMIALGDNLNDQSLLEVADYPFVVQSSPASELLAAALHLPLTCEAGARGWNEAIRDFLCLNICGTQL